MDSGDVKALAALARLRVGPDEEESLLRDFNSVLAFVEEIKKVSVSDDIPLSDHRNVMREDGAPHASSLYTERLLGLAPKSQGTHVVVKKVIEHGR